MRIRCSQCVGFLSADADRLVRTSIRRHDLMSRRRRRYLLSFGLLSAAWANVRVSSAWIAPLGGRVSVVRWFDDFTSRVRTWHPLPSSIAAATAFDSRWIGDADPVMYPEHNLAPAPGIRRG